MLFPTLLALALTGLTTAANTGTIVLHSQNHCHKSPVDRQCGHIPAGGCCVTNGGKARSVSFKNVKGNECHVGTNGCQNIEFTAKSTGKGECLFHTGPKGTWSSAKFTNPLSKRVMGSDTCEAGECESVMYPNQAVVYGTTTFNIVGLSAEQNDVLDTLAENGTAIGAFPAFLTGLIVPDVEPEDTSFSGYSG